MKLTVFSGSTSIEKKKKTQEEKSDDQFNIWSKSTESDMKMIDEVLRAAETSPAFTRTMETRDRSNSLLEHRKLGRFRWEVDISEVKVLGAFLLVTH